VDPYRDDRQALIAMLEAAEARAKRAEERATAAEARARVAEDRVKRSRRASRAAPGEILVVRLPGRLEFIEPGNSAFGLGRLVLGSLPNERIPVKLRARRVFARDGEVDLDLTVVIGLAADDDGRTAAARQFIDATADDLAAAAAPLIETAMRRVVAMRSTVDIERAIGGLAEDVRATAQPALRDLGLDVGQVLLAPLAGTVTRDG
jgi:hypothetical protein